MRMALGFVDEFERIRLQLQGLAAGAKNRG